MHRRDVLRAGVALSLPAVAGCNRDPVTPSATATPAPERRWRTAVETAPSDTPMLVDDTVVFVTEIPGEEPFPAQDAYAALLGYAAGDGSRSWSFEAEDAGAVTAAYRDTVLTSWRGDTVALGADGTDRWRRVYESTAALFGHGNAYVRVGDAVEGVVGPGVRAVDAVNGSIRWHLPGEWSLSPVATDDDALYVRGTAEASDVRFGLHRVDAADGTVEWTTPVGPRQDDPVLHADGTLVVGGNPEPTVRRGGTSYPDRPTVEGVAADDGTVRWRFTPAPDVAHPRRAADGTVLVKSWTDAEPNGPPNHDSSTLYALDVADGTERWRVAGTTTRGPGGADRFESWSVATEVVGAGAAFVRLADGSVTAHDLADGRERWRFDTYGAASESAVPVGSHQPDLAFAGGDLLVTYADRIAALDPATGRRRWEYATGEPLSRFWTVTDDAVVLTTETSLEAVERV